MSKRLSSNLIGASRKSFFDQIRRWVMYGCINTVVLDIVTKEMHQGCGPATNIKKRAFFSSREPIIIRADFSRR